MIDPNERLGGKAGSCTRAQVVQGAEVPLEPAKPSGIDIDIESVLGSVGLKLELSLHSKTYSNQKMSSSSCPMMP